MLLEQTREGEKFWIKDAALKKVYLKLIENQEISPLPDGDQVDRWEVAGLFDKHGDLFDTHVGQGNVVPLSYLKFINIAQIWQGYMDVN